MRQITHAFRCLSIALVLVAAFAALSPTQPAAAREPAPPLSQFELRIECKLKGGEFFRFPSADGSVLYMCFYPDGSDTVCKLDAGSIFPECTNSAALYAPAGDVPNVPAGEASDQPSPAPRGPTGSSDSGYESKPSWQ